MPEHQTNPTDAPSPAPPRVRRLRPEHLVLALACAYTLWVILARNQPNPLDDAYITFTYAKSLITGQGLVYPPHERVFGSTSPLYVFLLALAGIGSTPNSLPAVAVLLNALALCSTAILGYALLATISDNLRPAGTLAALLILLNPKLQAACLGGMESLVFTAWILAACLLCLRGREGASGAVLGLAVLTRPEGVLAGVAVALWRWTTTRRLPWRIALGGLLVLLPWVVGATLWFGSPLPHNLVVKLNAFHHYDRYPGATVKMLLTEIPALLGLHGIDISRAGRQPWFTYPSLPLTTAAFAILAALLAWRHRATVMLSGTLLLYFLFHAAGNKLYFGWYGVPPIPLLTLVLFGGLQCALQPLARFASLHAARLPALALIACALALLVRTPPKIDGLRDAHTILVQGHPTREPNYRAAAEFLNARAATPDTLALPEVGAVGFYSHHHCIDLVGLVTPAVLPLRAAGYDYGQIVEQVHPRWIITHTAYAEPILTNAAFRATFQKIAQAGPVLVFERTP